MEKESVILHSDLNCYYASVEMNEHPELKGKKVAVCGSTENRHGIVLTASYPAKRCGVKTGMVSAEDNATYEKMEADVVALGKEIERLERQAAIDREMDQPTSTPLVSRPTPASVDRQQGRATDEYKKAWNISTLGEYQFKRTYLGLKASIAKGVSG